VVVARQHTLPDEIGLLPHGLGDVVDPADPQAVLRTLEDLRSEVDRRRPAASVGNADLVVVVREAAELEPDAQLLLAALTADGPENDVQLVAASDRPVAELLERCPWIDYIVIVRPAGLLRPRPYVHLCDRFGLARDARSHQATLLAPALQGTIAPHRGGMPW
jgi:hypothetical protein